MATTWTCANGHTHDTSKLNNPYEPAATPGAECKFSGDRMDAQDYGSSAATVTPKGKFIAATRGRANL